jgi:esterase/lipase
VRFTLAGVVALAAIGLGPRERFEERWVEPDLPEDLGTYLDDSERGIPRLRAEAASEIVWAPDQKHERTAISLVYLHGFSADRHEIEPVVSELGAELGANVFFARLTGHGQDGDAMGDVTVEGWLADASEAVAIGGRIGERVVLIGTSTGGTLAAWAANRPEARSRVAALVLLSPNFHPKDRSSRLLLLPWGGLVARLAVGRERCFTAMNEQQAFHWTTCYPTSALLPMMALVEHVRTADLGGIGAATLVAYSGDDTVVDAEETERVLHRLRGTEPVVVDFTASQDPAQHVLAGDVVSPSSTEALKQEILAFLEPLRRDRSGEG